MHDNRLGYLPLIRIIYQENKYIIYFDKDLV